MHDYKSLRVAVMINSQLSVNSVCYLLLLHIDVQKRDFFAHIQYAIPTSMSLYSHSRSRSHL